MNVYDRVVPNEAVDTLGARAWYWRSLRVRRAHEGYTHTSHRGRRTQERCHHVVHSLRASLRATIGELAEEHSEFANTFNQFESIRAFFASATIVALVDLPFALIFLFVISYIGDALVAVPLITMSIVLTYALIINQPLRASVRATYAATAKNTPYSLRVCARSKLSEHWALNVTPGGRGKKRPATSRVNRIVHASCRRRSARLPDCSRRSIW